ncbi:hypothetical protein CVP04_09945 [Caviibacterium pharyngocola]|uniref:Carboxymuconolactone decarboxylase family protein n=1 Tax=Caviibacterium pharyngocola TaxID=28159 RepID=A0A2M8RTQ8_9PAST|nr:hypothetical protein CVP04_09945 [Caviibacterium pharyngocola]
MEKQSEQPLTKGQLLLIHIAGLTAKGDVTQLKSALYYQQGVETLATLTNAPTQRPIFDFAPALDYSIKSHLYGYLFSRTDLLSAVDRELVTIGALSELGGVNGQLRSHLTAVKNLGFNLQHFEQVISTVSETFSQESGKNVANMLKEVK